jgi:misacylated tRNA(Ala) deacylase
MTEFLFYENAYLKDFEAKIIEVDSSSNNIKLVLNKTAFYPGGGGQPFDQGWISIGDSRLHILKVKKEGGEIWHILEQTTVELKPEDLVTAEIDWDRRYKTMRTHTAMHILCGVIWRDYGASVTGGNMEIGKGRMDFEFETMRRELVEEIETKCNIEVKAAREIRTQILPRADALQIPDLIRTKVNLIPESIKEIRTVEIVGLDIQADGGIHVKNTKEVGKIRVVDYKSKGAINKRIYIEID